VGTTDALRKQVAKRNRNGILFQRPEMEVLTDAEKDTLIQDYLDAGYSGLPKSAQLLIQGGVVNALRSRGHPQQLTNFEMRLLAPGASFAYASCQMIAEMARLVHSGRTTAAPPFKMLADLPPSAVRPETATKCAPAIGVPLPGGQVVAHSCIRCRLM
jgi:hypothetical protein